MEGVKCAEEVLEYYKRNENKFDILITDIEMNGISGVDLANTVRKCDRNVIRTQGGRFH